MDKLGPAYLMARESAAERVNTLRMGLMLVFMEMLVGCIIWFSDYYCKYVLRLGLQLGREVGAIAFSSRGAGEIPLHLRIGSTTAQFSSIRSDS
ncbi:hypothetical protein QUB06_13345 [Microcoleus sp. D2_18a_D3]